MPTYAITPAAGVSLTKTHADPVVQPGSQVVGLDGHDWVYLRNGTASPLPPSTAVVVNDTSKTVAAGAGEFATGPVALPPGEYGWIRHSPAGTPSANVAPAFTTQPSLTGTTALGSTITVSLGAASGTPAPTLTGALTRPGKATVAVLNGDTFQIEAADQGGTITLDVTATNAAGSISASATMAPPAQVAPTVTIPDDGGYRGTTATVTPAGEITITNVETFHSDPSLYVFHYFVRADNMLGKTLVARRSTDRPNTHGGDLTEWQMAWAYDPDGEWFAFDNVVNAGAMITASNNNPCTQGTVYVARRPVFTSARWDRAIARWRANPLTSPTASANAQFVIGTLPAQDPAPAMDCYGFKVGTGTRAVTVTGNVHTGEHIGAYAYEAFVDWLLGSSADAIWLRANCTFYCYPKLNPQGRYAGVQRTELTTGNTTNSNRIFYPPADYAHIPLSAVMTAAWAADLPATIDASLDFHDTAVSSVTGARGHYFQNNGGDFVGFARAEYLSRTGQEIVVEPSVISASITSYMALQKAAPFGIAVEHQISSTVSIPEWQAWGRDQGVALRSHFDRSGGAKWIKPDWIIFPDTTVTDDNGALGLSRDGSPGAAFLIPEGKTIEVIFDLTMTNISGTNIRQSDLASLPSATSTTLHTRSGSSAPYRRVQQVTWTAQRPYVGFILGRNNAGLPASATVQNITRYRVLP